MARPTPCNTNYRPIDPSSDFDPESFAKWYDRYKELQQTDSSEIKEFLYTSDYAKNLNISDEEAGRIKSTALGFSQNSLIDFSRNNSSKLVETINESAPEELKKLAISQEHYAEGSDEYNSTRDTILETREEIMQANNDPQEYLTNTILDGCNEFQKALVHTAPDAHIRAYVQAAQQELEETLKDYGTTNFVDDLIKAREPQYDEQRTKIEGLETQTKNKLSKAQSEEEEEEIVKDYKKQKEGIIKDEQYQNAIQEFPGILLTLADTNYQLQKQQEEEN